MSQRNLRLGCSTGQFDVVVAISETMLNNQLKTYRKHTQVKKFSRIDESLDGYTLSADLGSIRVAIPAKDGQCRMLYHVVLDKASLMMKDGTKQTLDGTDLAFEVDVDLQHVHHEDLPQLRTLLNVPDEFSIQRLVLNFGLVETSQFNSSESVIKTDAVDAALQEVNDALQKLAASWLVHHNDVEAQLLNMQKSLGGDRKSVKFPIMYYALPPKPEKKPGLGIYTPTAVIHQLYASPVQAQDSKANCLLYLETVDKDAKLPNDTTFSTNNGIFVAQDDDTSPIEGSMAISSKVFFENYLLPILKPVVKQAELDCVAAGPGSKLGQYQWNYKFGDNANHRDYNDDYFLMKRQKGRDEIYSGSAWFNNRVPGMENTNGWRWLGDVDVAGSANPDETNAAKLTGRSIVNLQFQPGSNKAVLTGWSTMELHVRSQRDWDTKLSTQIATTGKWSIEFTVEVGAEGKLSIRPTWGGDVNFKDWRRSDGGAEVVRSREVLDEFHGKFRESLDGVKKYLEELEGKMKQHCFVIAGHGYFFMEKPVFNNNGDLLVELHYDGVPKAGKAPAPFTTSIRSNAIQVPSVINASTKATAVVAQVG